LSGLDGRSAAAADGAAAGATWAPATGAPGKARVDEARHARTNGLRIICDFRRRCGVSSMPPVEGRELMRAYRLFIALALTLVLTGCREVRVQTFRVGTTTVAGGNQILVFRDADVLQKYGIKAPVRFAKEFGVLLLMGPHNQTGWSQLIESIRANSDRVRIVAFERAPLDGGEPAHDYRTYTLWIVPNSVYRSGSIVDVVTPSGDLIASTTLR
jgi:hypothetical protein